MAEQLRGEALLLAALGADPSVGAYLHAALWQHIKTGESLDDILGLRGDAGGAHSPRRVVLREARDQKLRALTDRLQREGQSLWQAAQTISYLLSGDVELEDYPAWLLDGIEDVYAMSFTIDSPLSDARSIYRKLSV